MAQFTYTGKGSINVQDLSTSHDTVDVYGLNGNVQNASIAFVGFNHGYPNDLDMLLVAPDGQHNFEFMSDTGGTTPASGVAFGFSDDAMAQLLTVATGTYLPTDLGTVETASNWGLAIPTIHHPSSASFASSFGGIDGKGDWSLYLHDDAPGDVGGITQWKLTVTTGMANALLQGTASDDLIRVVSTAAGEGVFEINERGGVAYNGVFNFIVDGGDGNDLIITDGAVDQIVAGAGRDTVHAGGGTDYVSIGSGDGEAGEVYDGGSGDDWLIRDGNESLDLRDDSVTSFEYLQLHDGGKVMVTAAQASMFTDVLGDTDLSHPDELAVTMGASTGVNLGLIAFFDFNQTGDIVSITGDGDAETIEGSKVNDVISAGGGNDFITGNLGRDTIDGGKGSDRVEYLDRSVSVQVALKGNHLVNVLIDGVIEDSIKNVENITGGSAADIIKGDNKANWLIGLDNDDILKGGGGSDLLQGGLGSDTVSGGAGKDQFIFFTAVDAVDHIKDFSHVDDTIGLGMTVFAAFTKLGDIKAKMFVANDSGHDAHTGKQHLIYDKSDGSLWYDADGKGAGAAVEIAVLDNHPQNLDFHDFLII